MKHVAELRFSKFAQCNSSGKEITGVAVQENHFSIAILNHTVRDTTA